jgi:uncharacterized membrane protein
MMKQKKLYCGLNCCGMQTEDSSILTDYTTLRYHISKGITKWLLSVMMFCSFLQVKAQEPLMAKANMMFTVSYGANNYNRMVLEKYVHTKFVNDPSISYNIQYSNPLNANVDYAMSDYTSLGLGVNYYSFDLNEKRTDTIHSYDLETKGRRIAIQIRAMRYVIQRPRSIVYFFAGAGARFRSVTYNSTDSIALRTAAIHHTADGSLSTYSPISMDLGVGAKFLLIRNIGISAEVGMLTSIAQVGLFYSFKNKWRKSHDNIGW